MTGMTPHSADDAVTESPWVIAARAFESWRAGDAAAVDELIRVLTPVLWHVVRAYRLDAEVAQDVVQATWLVFVRSHESIQDPRAVSSWLLTSARREAARAAQRSGKLVPVAEDTLAPHLPLVGSAEDGAVAASEDSALWRAVDALDQRCQRLLRVVAFSDRPDYHQLATDLQMPMGSIGPTRSRCLTKLRRALEGGAS